ncbi:MAG: HAD-IIIC family phosphatase [Candidatus Latescibacterota bacterium]|nr:HAD-IIIC family phosphatase [Candidatus Latescibacterota bacterium]
MTIYSVVSDFNISPFVGYLRRELGEGSKVVDLGNSTVQTVLMSWSEFPINGGSKIDRAVVWTRPEAMFPSFLDVLNGKLLNVSKLDREIEEFLDLLELASENLSALWVPLWVRSDFVRGMGIGEYKKGGLNWALQRINNGLIQRASLSGTIHVLDTYRWLSLSGLAHDPKLWFMGKIPFTNPIFRKAVCDLDAGRRALDGQTAKLIVLDLDGTLWGGIVGESGWSDLVLGGHDHVGEAYSDFQKALKALSCHGILLAVASRNQESVALEAIDSHPEMILRRNDFVGWRIDWNDKAENITSLASELNIGLSNIVFIDDQSAERSRVREALPEVVVPEWPDDPAIYVKALGELVVFDSFSVSDEDRQRKSLYAGENQRQASKLSSQSISEWLSKLQLTVSCESLTEDNISRAVQLLNKTNQVNLRTRRLSKEEFLCWSEQEDHECWVFSSKDRFGDSGIIGLVGLEPYNDGGTLADYVLSCRVLGRGIEQVLLHVALFRAFQKGWDTLWAECVPTEKNRPCLEIMNKMLRADESNKLRFFCDPKAGLTLPKHVQLEI